MLRAWPICAPPEIDESLVSWIERVAREYSMSPTALLNSVDSAPRRAVRGSTRPAPEHLLDPALIERLSALGQISSAARTRLWPPRTDWELHSFTFCAYCPQCCLDDLARHGVP